MTCIYLKLIAFLTLFQVSICSPNNTTNDSPLGLLDDHLLTKILIENTDFDDKSFFKTRAVSRHFRDIFHNHSYGAFNVAGDLTYFLNHPDCERLVQNAVQVRRLFIRRECISACKLDTEHYPNLKELYVQIKHSSLMPCPKEVASLAVETWKKMVKLFPNAKKIDIIGPNNDNLVSMIVGAIISSGQEDYIKLMDKTLIDALDSGLIDVNHMSRDGFTPLHLAIYSNSTSITNLLFKYRAKAQTSQGRDRMFYTPLDLAVSFNYLHFIPMLINQGATVHTGYALEKAVSNRNIEAIEMLIQIDPTIVNDRFPFENSTAIFAAIRSKNYKSMEILLKNKADVNIVDVYGYTPLLVAIEQGDLACLLDVVEHGADIEFESVYGTPLYFAMNIVINHGIYSNAVHVLLRHGADLDRVDSKGRNALSFAIRNAKNCLLLCEILEDYGYTIAIEKYVTELYRLIKIGDPILIKSIITAFLRIGLSPYAKFGCRTLFEEAIKRYRRLSQHALSWDVRDHYSNLMNNITFSKAKLIAMWDVVAEFILHGADVNEQVGKLREEHLSLIQRLEM